MPDSDRVHEPETQTPSDVFDEALIENTDMSEYGLTFRFLLDTAVQAQNDILGLVKDVSSLKESVASVATQQTNILEHQKRIDLAVIDARSLAETASTNNRPQAEIQPSTLFHNDKLLEQYAAEIKLLNKRITSCTTTVEAQREYVIKEIARLNVSTASAGSQVLTQLGDGNTRKIQLPVSTFTGSAKIIGEQAAKIKLLDDQLTTYSTSMKQQNSFFSEQISEVKALMTSTDAIVQALIKDVDLQKSQQPESTIESTKIVEQHTDEIKQLNEKVASSSSSVKQQKAYLIEQIRKIKASMASTDETIQALLKSAQDQRPDSTHAEVTKILEQHTAQIELLCAEAASSSKSSEQAALNASKFEKQAAESCQLAADLATKANGNGNASTQKAKKQKARTTVIIRPNNHSKKLDRATIRAEINAQLNFPKIDLVLETGKGNLKLISSDTLNKRDMKICLKYGTEIGTAPWFGILICDIPTDLKIDDLYAQLRSNYILKNKPRSLPNSQDNKSATYCAVISVSTHAEHVHMLKYGVNASIFNFKAKTFIPHSSSK